MHVIGQKPGRRGLTLLEATLAMTILPVAVLAIALAITAGQQQSAAAMQRGRAAMLAESMMERIISLAYADPDDGSTTLGPESGESDHTAYDNADDYCGQTIPAHQLTDAAGDPYPESLHRFDLIITCQSTSLNPLGADTPGLKVTIAVVEGNDEQTSVTRFLVRPGGGG